MKGVRHSAAEEASEPHFAEGAQSPATMGTIASMHVGKGAVAGGASLILLAVAAPARANSTVPAQATLFARSLAPPSYTFHLDVAMAMRHFPWLHFRLEGTGVYDPGESYVVHFSSVPWFIPRQQHSCDLSMLDPLMWPNRYTYQEVGQRDDETLFALQAIDDPSLKGATVAIGPKGRAREIDATYSDGTHIETRVNSSDVDGFFLPATMTADIDEPHLSLSADADFKDYDFAAQELPQSSSP